MKQVFFSILAVGLMSSCAGRIDAQTELRHDEWLTQGSPELETPPLDQGLDLIDLELLEAQTLQPEQQRPSKLDVHAERVPAKRFFLDLMNYTGQNFLVDPDLNIEISISLKQTELEQMLLALEDSHPLSWRRTEYGYHISEPKTETRIFRINYLNVSRSGSVSTNVSGGQLSSQGSTDGGSSVSTNQSSDFWVGLKATLESMLSDSVNSQLTVDPQSGLVFVKALNRELRQIEEYLNQAQLTMRQQVIIEAKILEVQLNDETRSGIDWTILPSVVAQLGSNDLAASSSVLGDNLAGFGTQGGSFSFALQLDNFSGVIQALQQQGDVQVLSSPRISTVNNQKAVIKVGADEYFVTNVSNQNTDDTTNNAPEVTLTPFFSGISLDVTPQIDDHGSVVLHVRPSVTDVQERSKVIALGDSAYNLPLAYSTIRETDSIIRANNGQIVVIGGLLQNRLETSHSGLPILSKLPYLGRLFSQETVSESTSELVILLRPLVISDDNQASLVESSLRTWQR